MRKIAYLCSEEYRGGSWIDWVIRLLIEIVHAFLTPDLKPTLRQCHETLLVYRGRRANFGQCEELV